MVKGEITKHFESGVETIEFFHPAGNSFPSALLAELIDTISNSTAPVIIVKSRGERAFCAGASFDELLALEDVAAAKEFFMGFARLILCIKSAPQPIFGMIQGKTVGGGVGLAAAFDYCGATVDASLKLSELNVGIGPFVIAPAVSHKIGISGLQALTYAPGDWKSAKWGYRRGLYHELFDDITSLESGINSRALALAKCSIQAVRAFKEASWQGTEHWPELMEERASMSGDLVLGPEARAFLETFKKK